MTKKEARKLIKDKASILYRGSALLLLSMMMESSFQFSEGPEDAARQRKAKETTLMRWIGVKQDQLRKMLKRFADDGLGTFSRKDGMVTFRLTLQPLEKLQTHTPKDGKADRAIKARAVYAAQRERNKVTEVQQFFVRLSEENKYRAKAFNGVTA